MRVIKINQAFRGYAMSYKVEIIEIKDPIVQLEASKSSIKDLFSDLLNETKGFKYQITVEVLLKNTSSMEKLNLLQLAPAGMLNQSSLNTLTFPPMDLYQEVLT